MMPRANHLSGSALGLGLVAALLATACAKRIPLPEHLRPAGVEELRQRMQKAGSPVQKYFAEARMTYFGADGRIKGSASLAVMRPQSLRYDLVGPHGGVIEAFATDGSQLQLLIPGEARLLEGPATPQNVDRMMSFAPLHLDPQGWVALLFGEVSVPAGAQLRYDDTAGHFVVHWSAAGSEVSLGVDPRTSRVVTAQVRQGERLASTVLIEERDPRGLPIRLRMKARVVTPEGSKDESDIRVILRDIEHDPAGLDAASFRLRPPRGVVPEPIAP